VPDPTVANPARDEAKIAEKTAGWRTFPGDGEGLAKGAGEVEQQDRPGRVMDGAATSADDRQHAASALLDEVGAGTRPDKSDTYTLTFDNADGRSDRPGLERCPREFARSRVRANLL